MAKLTKKMAKLKNGSWDISDCCNTYLSVNEFTIIIQMIR